MSFIDDDDDENFLPDDEESGDDIGCAFAFSEECPKGCEDCPYEEPEDISGFAYAAIKEGMENLTGQKCLSDAVVTEEKLNELYVEVYNTYVNNYIMYAINSFTKPLISAFTCAAMTKTFAKDVCLSAAAVAINRLTEIDYQINQQ